MNEQTFDFRPRGFWGFWRFSWILGAFLLTLAFLGDLRFYLSSNEATGCGWRLLMLPWILIGYWWLLVPVRRVRISSDGLVVFVGLLRRVTSPIDDIISVKALHVGFVPVFVVTHKKGRSFLCGDGTLTALFAARLAAENPALVRRGLPPLP